MITIYPSRLPPGDRVQTIGSKSGTQEVAPYNPPLLGLDLNALDDGRPDQNYARVMDNLMPGRSGLHPRAGCENLVNITGGGRINALLPFHAKRSILAIVGGAFHKFELNVSPDEADFNTALVNSTESNPTDFDLRSPGIPVGFEMVNADGEAFLIVLNGEDPPVKFDGSEVTDAKISNSDSEDIGSSLSFGLAFKKRAFFIEKNSLNVHYLAVDEISGTATRFPMQGIFSRSSSLSFGGSFSTDSGSGIDDYIVFVTNEGEVAIFSGSNPGDANDFKLQGVFDIGSPLSAYAHFSVGGDLIIGTTQGLVPLSAVLQKGVSELRLHSLSERIKPAINEIVSLARQTTESHFRMVKSDLMGLGILKPPRVGRARGDLYVVNTETNAWSRVTGWDVLDISVVGDRVFFTDGTGLFEAFVGGRDNGEPIQHRLVTGFDNLGLPGYSKRVHKVRATFLTSYKLSANIRLEKDGTIGVPKFPKAMGTSLSKVSNWGALKQSTHTFVFNVPGNLEPPYDIEGNDENGNTLILRENSVVSLEVDVPDPNNPSTTIRTQVSSDNFVVDRARDKITLIGLPLSGVDPGEGQNDVLSVTVSGVAFPDPDSTDARWEVTDRAEEDKTRWPNFSRYRDIGVAEDSPSLVVESAAFQITFSTDGPSPLDTALSSMQLSFTRGQKFY